MDHKVIVKLIGKEEDRKLRFSLNHARSHVGSGEELYVMSLHTLQHLSSSAGFSYNVNVVHSMHLLAAEYSILKGNKTKAEESFKSSISVAKQRMVPCKIKDWRTSLPAHTYYATKGDDFILGDDYWANYHMVSAMRSFSDWGATFEVELFA